MITVCDHANQICPVFPGEVRRRVHIGFDDPAAVRGTDEEVLAPFRRVRDEIGERLRRFYKSEIGPMCEKQAETEP